MSDPAGLLAIVLLIVLNGCFVAAEFALVTVRWTRIEELVEQGVRGARAVQSATEKMDGMIAATQLGITLCSLGVGWLGEPAVAHLVFPLIQKLGLPWTAAIAHGVAIGVSFLLITYVHVVLGELAPKAVALQSAERVAILLVPALLAFERVFRPLSGLMRKSGGLVVRLLRIPEPSVEQSVHSTEEIDRLVEETQEAGLIPAEEAKYVRNVFELADKTVMDAMVPREKVVTLSLRATEGDILETSRETGHTRMPVWEDDPDHIVGVVNTKDLFHIFSLRGLVILMDAMYPAIVVRPEQPIAQVLGLFRRMKRQMAIVNDASGKFLGIVTLEDILEEIVGEIEDEHD
jgi:CBS domain containing-hemolysin-like protein